MTRNYLTRKLWLAMFGVMLMSFSTLIINLCTLCIRFPDVGESYCSINMFIFIRCTCSLKLFYGHWNFYFWTRLTLFTVGDQWGAEDGWSYGWWRFRKLYFWVVVRGHLPFSESQIRDRTNMVLEKSSDLSNTMGGRCYILGDFEWTGPDICIIYYLVDLYIYVGWLVFDY